MNININFYRNDWAAPIRAMSKHRTRDESLAHSLQICTSKASKQQCPTDVLVGGGADLDLIQASRRRHENIVWMKAKNRLRTAARWCHDGPSCWSKVGDGRSLLPYETWRREQWRKGPFCDSRARCCYQLRQLNNLNTTCFDMDFWFRRKCITTLLVFGVIGFWLLVWFYFISIA